MKQVIIKTLRDLFPFGNQSEIRNNYEPIPSEAPVRIFTLSEDQQSVTIDAISEQVVLPANSQVYFQPWALDRGNLLVMKDGRNLKLCCEADVLICNNERYVIEPTR